MVQNKKPSLDELLEASELLLKISQIDLGKLEVEKYEALKPVDRLIHDLEQGTEVHPKPRKGKKLPKNFKHSPTCKGRCGGRCGSRHWRKRNQKRREYYRTSERPAYIRKKIENLKTPEGTYKVVTYTWRKKKIPYFSLEEWLSNIYPKLKGRVPMFTRYDVDKGYILENVFVRDADTGEVIFDGAEYALRQLGYIL